MLALAMLLGSIPFGHIAVRLRAPGRARDEGIGVETIRRAVGWPGLALVVALNVAKGFVTVWLAKGALPTETVQRLLRNAGVLPAAK